MTPQDQWVLQKERALAWLRVGFAVVALIVVQLNPSRVALFPVLSIFFLGTFFLYSIILVYLVQKKTLASGRIGLATTCLDLAWISVIVFSTGGTRTPFFFYYSFPVITASSRWGVKGSIAVAAIGVALYGAIRITLAAEAIKKPIGIDTFLVRSIYLFALACIFGVLSGFEKKQNQKLLALSKTAGEVATLVERRRIMQDVHDGLLQSLATQILRLETCRRHLLKSPEALDRELRSIEDDTRNSMKVIREFLRGKEAHALLPGMLLETLREDLRFLRDGLGLAIILDTEPESLELPAPMEQDLYYLVREGLMNIARHSHAAHVDITLRQSAAEIRGWLTDDGVGFDQVEAGNNHGLGLPSMKERIKRLGGELEIQSSPGKGTKISFTLPLVIEPGDT
jgi:signal transduction histidine kinase